MPVEPVVEELPTSTLKDHAILVGYGRVGSSVGEALAARGRKLLVVEEREDLVARLREQGVEVIQGPVAPAPMIKAANAAEARWLFVAIPNCFEAGQIVRQAREANPSIRIFGRAHSDAEVEHLRSLGADVIVMAEREVARSMVEQAFGGEAAEAEARAGTASGELVPLRPVPAPDGAGAGDGAAADAASEAEPDDEPDGGAPTGAPAPAAA